METETERRYKISVRVFSGQILTFTVDNYSIVDGSYIEFTDKKTLKVKRFHTSHTEIEVLQ
jgi:hypothetical protein